MKALDDISEKQAVELLENVKIGLIQAIESYGTYEWPRDFTPHQKADIKRRAAKIAEAIVYNYQAALKANKKEV